jgi:tRNA(Ser,Leu) C12 N-acetylase TAN1
MHSFDFHSAEELRDKAASIMREWNERLVGRLFHVRLHRRGGRHELRSPDVERSLDDKILAATQHAGVPAMISFSGPEVVIAIDTVDDRAGIALWTREDLARHRLLRPD